MISLTRKMRRRSLVLQRSKGRTGYMMKYLRYAGGEVLLVVIAYS